MLGVGAHSPKQQKQYEKTEWKILCFRRMGSISDFVWGGEGRGVKKVSQKFPEITLNHTYYRSVFVFNYRTAFMGLNFAAFFIIANISYTLTKME